MFTVRVPFTVPEKKRIREDAATLTVNGVIHTLSFDGHHHILKSAGFPTEEAAHDFLNRLEAGFAWLLLDNGIPAAPFLVPQDVTYHEDPEAVGRNLANSFGTKYAGPVHATIDGNMAAVYLTDRPIKTLTAFPLNATQHIGSDRALKTIVDGAALPGSPTLGSAPKLGIALSLYSAHYTESSPNARFLALVMALEAIADATLKPPSVLDILTRWRGELDELLAVSEQGSEEAIALDALRRELTFRRDDSLRSQIRKLVSNTLHADPDVAETAREAVRIYDVRSSLVHDGEVAPGALEQATQAARSLVHRILLARFRAVVGR